ncbi:hypothetical protein U9M48_004881 [Paspalum notatum var. saurae]|uniref:Protein kinase domain-containing protein n=1 Tax=Paspalum notatum var. saurae TaxID=547442 RepID=A0AAQ3PPL2_PASNO
MVAYPITLQHLHPCSIIPLNSSKHKKSLAPKVTIPFISMVAFVMVIFGLLLSRRKQNSASISLPSFGSKFPKVSCSDIAKATKGLSTSNLIGKGRYSSVYQGKLFHERIVAINVFNMDRKGANKSFIAECNALRNMRHRNLVAILTACSILIYEFMPRGDLHALLYMNRDGTDNEALSCGITLAQRLSIVVDVANALEYLHHNNQPSKILLDDNMTAHVGDFGLARFKADSTSSFIVRGTIGYVAPGSAHCHNPALFEVPLLNFWTKLSCLLFAEGATGGDSSNAGDVYSFGIVLLELFLRKWPTDDMFNDGWNIVKKVETNFPDRILWIVDPELLEEQHDFP